MPTVAVVDGISIRFYNDEHPPPHFHAVVAEHQALRIDRLQVVAGYLPAPKLRKVIAWSRPRKLELHAAWLACQRDQNPGKIE